MAIVFIPALVALLEAKEKDFGWELPREDVESVRDTATAIELPAEIARDMIKSWGYPDIDAENVWDEWLLHKKTMNSDLFRPDFVDHYTSWSPLVAVEPQDTGSPSQTTGIPLDSDPWACR
nr:hypothetical protein [Providencia rettgeri]